MFRFLSVCLVLCLGRKWEFLPATREENLTSWPRQDVNKTSTTKDKPRAVVRKASDRIFMALRFGPQTPAIWGIHEFTALGSQYVASNPVTDYEYNQDADAYLRLHTEPAAFWDAHDNCQREGGVLASPATEELVQAMRATLTDHKLESGSVFAATAAQAKGDRAEKNLILGKASLVLAGNEPLSAASGDQCLALTGAGALADVSCARAHPYFCRRESTHKCGDKGIGYEYDARTGSCYKFHRNALAFRTALATCHAEGGLLAVINSDTESNVLREIFKKNPAELITGADDPAYALVGFRKYEDGEFATVYGNTLAQAGFSQWSAGEPNNGGGNELCGSIHRDGLLNDISCTRACPYICEVKP